MDGHHRLTVAKRLNLKGVPVVLFDYDEVHVEAWRYGEIVTPDSIIDMATRRKKFPCKTTRHILKTPIPVCNVPLCNLRSLNFVVSRYLEPEMPKGLSRTQRTEKNEPNLLYSTAP